MVVIVYIEEAAVGMLNVLAEMLNVLAEMVNVLAEIWSERK